MPDATSVDYPEPPPEPILMDAAQIQAIIPHRPPFLMVDRVVELEPGTHIVAEKDVNADTDWYLQGHFPDYPIMPGVLIVEALAQTGAILVMLDPQNKTRLPFLARIDSCRFRQPVLPGATLRLEIETTASRGPIGKAHGRARVGGTVVCEADITFAFGTAQH